MTHRGHKRLSNVGATDPLFTRSSPLLGDGILLSWNLCTRRGMTVRPPSRQRHSAIDSAAHGLVAIACRCFEPRSVNLNKPPPIGSDGARRPKLVHDLRHGRSSYSEQLRKFL